MQKLTTCLWFGGNGAEALDYYTSIFKEAKVLTRQNYPASMMPEGTLLTATLEIFGQELILLNADHQFQFNESISLVIHCKDQAETDYYWDSLSKEGQTSQCGWLKDKYGLSWQIVPVQLIKLITHPDKEKGNKAMQAMMKMAKIDIAAIEAAVNN